MFCCIVITPTDEEVELLSHAAAAEGGSGIGIGMGDRPPSLYMLKLLRYLETRGCAAAGRDRAAFSVSLQHIYVYSPRLYTAVVSYPQDATAAFDALIRNKFADLKDIHGLFGEDNPNKTPDELLLQQVYI